jgi:hypothetical protein
MTRGGERRTGWTDFNPQIPLSSPQILENPGTTPFLSPVNPHSYSRTKKTVLVSPSWKVDGSDSFDNDREGCCARLELDPAGEGVMMGIGWDEGAKTGYGRSEGYRVVELRPMGDLSG